MTALAVAIPAYNEADGIAEFLIELDHALSGLNLGSIDFYVVDDHSNDETARVVAELDDTLKAGLHVVRNERNLGHGPTVLRAYRGAISSGADLVLQVDGDGQFDGADVAQVVASLQQGTAVVFGVRRNREDPWFRRVLSRLLRLYVRLVFGARVRDVNCPLRVFRSSYLAAWLQYIPDDALVPNVYLAALGSRAVSFEQVEVRHRVRRGENAQGTMWGRRQRRVLPPRRLVEFVLRAAQESLRMARRIRGATVDQTSG